MHTINPGFGSPMGFDPSSSRFTLSPTDASIVVPICGVVQSLETVVIASRGILEIAAPEPNPALESHRR
jgi:hypothetical protein